MSIIEETLNRLTSPEEKRAFVGLDGRLTIEPVNKEFNVVLKETTATISTHKTMDEAFQAAYDYLNWYEYEAGRRAIRDGKPWMDQEPVIIEGVLPVGTYVRMKMNHKYTGVILANGGQGVSLQDPKRNDAFKRRHPYIVSGEGSNMDSIFGVDDLERA